jgi:hypothetical protein
VITCVLAATLQVHATRPIVSPQQELDEDATLVTDATGRRPRRKAAVSASKTLRATRDSPDAPSSDDEYKGDTEQEGEEAISDEEDADSPTDDGEDDNDE